MSVDSPNGPHDDAPASGGESSSGKSRKTPKTPKEEGLPKNRRGEPCGRCARIKTPGKRCPLHGGKSTGPKTSEGKKRARGNATKHGLKSKPERYAADMTDELRTIYEEAVSRIAEAEGVSSSPLDLAIVRDFVLADMILTGGREWLLKRGFLTVESWRAVKLGDVLVPERDVHNEMIRAPVVPESLVDAINVLSKLKAKLHERLRARGDAAAAPGSAQNPLVMKVFGFDPSSFPPPKTDDGGPAS